MSHRAMKFLTSQPQSFWDHLREPLFFPSSDITRGATDEQSAAIKNQKVWPSVQTGFHLRPFSATLQSLFLLSARCGNIWKQLLLEASQQPQNQIRVPGTAAPKQFKMCFSVLTVSAPTNNRIEYSVRLKLKGGFSCSGSR